MEGGIIPSNRMRISARMVEQHVARWERFARDDIACKVKHGARMCGRHAGEIVVVLGQGMSLGEVVEKGRDRHTRPHEDRRAADDIAILAHHTFTQQRPCLYRYLVPLSIRVISCSYLT